MIDVSYVGDRGVHIQQGNVDFDQLPTQYLSLGSQLLQQVSNPYYGKITASGCAPIPGPTIAYGQLLRPFPEFADVKHLTGP